MQKKLTKYSRYIRKVSRGVQVRKVVTNLSVCVVVLISLFLDTLMLCRDSFIASASQSALQMNVKLLYITSNSQRLQVQIKMLTPYQ